ncbi:EamA family transporter RarD [Sporosarcina cyprini]|uniref:EamA family transporter RarD n=1 Tax=Sporosarcina cyprini TaxID=2910523 RepID=UPI001EE119D8|nr:EamA family transporter RarD [Sporosarcina cyprini]MCG3089414.1 EamA family transporter RarD [Sporosarcina cyprini]
MQTDRNGVIWVVASFVIWGFMPIYWKYLEHVSSDEILTGRIVWAFISTLLVVLLIRGGGQLVHDFRKLWKDQRSFWSLFAASVLVTSNWFIYIWAVNHHFIVQTSLGYYMNPLVSVLLGVLFLKEKMSSAQKAAFVLAAIGVITMVFFYGKFPWIAVGLALSFAVYGFIKKNIQLDALRGLAIETMFIFPFAVGYYIWLFITGEARFLHVDTQTDVLLILTGVATALPLVLYAKGVQRIPLYLSGFIQYIAPTLMLIIGVLMYHETFGQQELLSFSFIWAALILFTTSKVYETVKMRRSHV